MHEKNQLEKMLEALMGEGILNIFEDLDIHALSVTIEEETKEEAQVKPSHSTNGKRKLSL